MLKVFILCAGEGDRWNDHLDIPKQLITFGGETLIERTARLVSNRTKGLVYCVALDERISLAKNDTLFVSYTASLAETILATYKFWSDRNIFLLGDVFYSERAISWIFAEQRDLIFFGRPWPSAFVKCGHGEMFGLSFTSDTSAYVRNLVTQGLSNKPTEIQANLWYLYQLAGGVKLGSSKFLPHLLVPIDDYTNDIDTPIDYQRRNWLYETVSSGRTCDVLLAVRYLVLLPKHFLGILRWHVINL
ncbi:MAG: NTP transferase domain-containing protein [Gallionella sp.]|nr:NTP transferase domain-containing protein [Gallionella sp.]